MTDPTTEQESFVRSFHGIPEDNKLSSMSFAELASELGSSAKDSPKYLVIEREIKRHLAHDQADINKKNVILGSILGGLFGLAGVFLGWHLRSLEPSKEIATTSSVSKGEKTELTVEARVTAPSASNPVANHPVRAPSPVASDAQKRP